MTGRRCSQGQHHVFGYPRVNRAEESRTCVSRRPRHPARSSLLLELLVVAVPAGTQAVSVPRRDNIQAGISGSSDEPVVIADKAIEFWS